MREYFHVPDNYFLSHSVGCLPKVSPGTLQTGLFGPWMSGENWALWMEELETKYVTPLTEAVTGLLDYLWTFGMQLFTPVQFIAIAVALLALAGLAAVALGDVMRRATAHGLELTRHALRDSRGRVLAEVEQIVRVHRGVFAFKPSNGFKLTLARAHDAAWMPGIWWRFGRQLGVGGVIPGTQAKYMAEVLEHLIAERGA